MIGSFKKSWKSYITEALAFWRVEGLLEDVMADSKSETSQNRYSAQTFIYLR